jgi:hypothetical protein
VYSQRKKISLAALALLWLAAARCGADSEGDPTCQAPDAKRYDGVGVRAIPRPPEPRRERRPAAVFTLRRENEAPVVSGEENAYDAYVTRSNRPFTPARVARLSETILNEGLRVLKRQARGALRAECIDGVNVDWVRYHEGVQILNKLRWGAEARPWRFQYDAIAPDLYGRYDSEWDDIHLAQWGPLTITDSGAIDVDTSLEGLQKFWTAGFEDVEVAPDPVREPRRLLVGQTVRLSHKINLRVSSSALLKTFYREKPEGWGGSALHSARYVRVAVGLDFHTDILKRRYLDADLEARYYPSGKWVAFLNVAFLDW